MAWHGFFKPIEKSARAGDLVITKIALNKELVRHRKVVISLPRRSGKAVDRNRLKRVLKTKILEDHFELLEKNGVWIRLQKGKKLERGFPVEPLKTSLDEILSSFSS